MIWILVALVVAGVLIGGRATKKVCPWCHEAMDRGAAKCPHCHEWAVRT
jgi:hypothetical protein